MSDINKDMGGHWYCLLFMWSIVKLFFKFFFLAQVGHYPPPNAYTTDVLGKGGYHSGVINDRRGQKIGIRRE